VSFINAHKERWGVEPICKVLQVAPSTYYAAVSRQPSVRRQRDEELKSTSPGSTATTSASMASRRSGGNSIVRASGLAVIGWPG
jgi:hypothetical protein